MKRMFLLLIAVAVVVVGLSAWTTFRGKTTYTPTMSAISFHSLSALTLEGDAFAFEQLRGKRVLIVNTASKCGFTPQYEGLESLYEQYKDNNFIVIGFPCNDFGRQEPGTADEIGAFCERNYGVSFPMMEKVSVKGAEQHAVYSWLCNASQNGVSDHAVKWNFHKFLVDENGQLVASLRSAVSPDDATITDFASGK